MVVWSSWGDLGNLVEGTWDPAYVQKSLMCTKLDTAMARLEGWEAMGRAGRLDLMVSTADKLSCGSRTAHPETKSRQLSCSFVLPPEQSLDTCAPTGLRWGSAVVLWPLAITTLLTIQAQCHYLILFSLDLFVHGHVCTWPLYESWVLAFWGVVRKWGWELSSWTVLSLRMSFWMRLNSSFHMAFCGTYMSPLNVLILCRRHNSSVSHWGHICSRLCNKCTCALYSFSLLLCLEPWTGCDNFSRPHACSAEFCPYMFCGPGVNGHCIISPPICALSGTPWSIVLRPGSGLSYLLASLTGWQPHVFKFDFNPKQADQVFLGLCSLQQRKPQTSWRCCSGNVQQKPVNTF